MKRVPLGLEQLEPRDLLSVTWVGDPGMTRNTAYRIGPVTGQVRTFSGAMERKDDVDLFAIELKAGQTAKIRIDDDWNHKHGTAAEGLRVNLNLYNSRGQIMREFPHQNVTSGFDAEIRAARDEVFYLGVSAAGNSRYDIFNGGKTSAPPYMASGTYTLSLSDSVAPAAPKALRPGVYVLGRDLNYPAVGRWGTHQFLVLVPQNPNRFRNLVDLGDGTKAIILGAHNRGNLLVVPGEAADVTAAREAANPRRPSSYHVEVARVSLGARDIDGTIQDLVRASDYYQEYTKRHPIPYPGAELLRGQGYNSNSWAQSIIYHVVGPGRVQENFNGRDFLYWNRIGREFFMPR